MNQHRICFSISGGTVPRGEEVMCEFLIGVAQTELLEGLAFRSIFFVVREQPCH